PGNKPNYPAAIRLYNKAIRLGSSLAMCSRARLYILGHCEPDNQPNYPHAIALYDTAICLGNRDSMYSMYIRAGMYESGLGEPGNKPNYPVAIALYKKALALGYLDAMVPLATLYCKRKGQIDNQLNYDALIDLHKRSNDRSCPRDTKDALDKLLFDYTIASEWYCKSNYLGFFSPLKQEPLNPISKDNKELDHLRYKYRIGKLD
ncbi:MAG: tetratricopeptide repeat protein, partial [Legionellales bacterium]